jgi:hypothetical protein
MSTSSIRAAAAYERRLHVIESGLLKLQQHMNALEDAISNAFNNGYLKMSDVIERMMKQAGSPLEGEAVRHQARMLSDKISACRPPADDLPIACCGLVHSRTGTPLDERYFKKSDTAVKIARWALQVATEFVSISGVAKSQAFDLVIGRKRIPFWVTPAEGAGRGKTARKSKAKKKVRGSTRRKRLVK